MKKFKSACTTILVGKNASIDGSTMIARNEDGSVALGPKKFVVITPDQQPRTYQSKISKVTIQLPDNPLRYTSTPDADEEKIGIWGESGINSKNVAMSATETITTNSRVLGIDPYVTDGIGEEDLLTIVLPYINSAKEGVLRLGALLEEFGTYEPNGIAFSDKEEIWWLETIGGHHWAAIRIPDDAYVIAPNRMNIDHYDFDSADVLYAKDLPDLIEKHHLNPDFEGVNLRHIFGSATIKDNHYNNPRAWYGQKYFDPAAEIEPTDQDLPFICYPKQKITIEDVKWVLSSHYQDTPYDPYGTGTEAEKKRFRPIGINRNHELHILQIRKDVPEALAGIHWLAFGPNTFNSVVPFYSNVEKTPACYRNTSDTCDLTNMYWLSCTAALLGDANYDLYSDIADSFEQETVAAFRYRQLSADQEAMKQENLTDYLAKVNDELAQISLEKTTAMIGKMIAKGANQMKLRFNLGD
ncbi:C69 family dipeptidase [Enterococcus songbeiensis]|uniref:C69 family dipeptidase n=1 Tax=Enterococcus songbeiensis TaxID=2559927 RepID=UPI0010F692D7|nr:C69 family dipeptidase [Enterococcus songbeiensis]